MEDNWYLKNIYNESVKITLQFYIFIGVNVNLY